MIDAHTHMPSTGTKPQLEALGGTRSLNSGRHVFSAQYNSRQTLESGVPTVRDLGHMGRHEPCDARSYRTWGPWSAGECRLGCGLSRHILPFDPAPPRLTRAAPMVFRDGSRASPRQQLARRSGLDQKCTAPPAATRTTGFETFGFEEMNAATDVASPRKVAHRHSSYTDPMAHECGQGRCDSCRECRRQDDATLRRNGQTRERSTCRRWSIISIRRSQGRIRYYQAAVDRLNGFTS